MAYHNVASRKRRSAAHVCHQRVDYSEIAREAVRDALRVCECLFPRGQRQGKEYVALNPKRADHRLGSFKISLVSGRWADFATGECGGDLISLVAWRLDIRQSEAALWLLQRQYRVGRAD